MRPGWLVAAVVLSLMLSGCTGSDEGSEQALPGDDLNVPSSSVDPTVGSTQPINESEDPGNITQRFDPIPDEGVAFGATGCRGGGAYLAVDLSVLQEALPPGFTALDSSQHTGAPVETGRGVLALEFYDCDTSAFAEAALSFGSVAVLVGEPEAGVQVSPVDSNWFELALYASDASLASLLVAAGGQAYEVSTEHSLLSVPNGLSTLQAAVEGDESGQWSIDATTLLAQRQVTFTKRVWQVSELGLIYVDLDVKSDVVQGAAACEFGSSTPAATVSGGTECRPEWLPRGIVLNDTNWSGRIHQLDGVVPS